jgi:histidine phosphotransferase ChpT
MHSIPWAVDHDDAAGIMVWPGPQITQRWIMATSENDRLTELLCSRLCHDLISPLSAITNGIELVSEGDKATFDDAIGLIGSSARQGASRLAYFRLALGAGGTEAGTAFGIVRKAVDEYFEDRKLRIDWVEPAPAQDAPLGRQVRKLLLNLMLVAGECAQRDASIAAQVFPGKPQIKISIKGGRSKMRDDVRTGFDSKLDVEGMTVRNVIAWNSRKLAEGLGLQLTVVEDGQTAVELNVA